MARTNPFINEINAFQSGFNTTREVFSGSRQAQSDQDILQSAINIRNSKRNQAIREQQGLQRIALNNINIDLQSRLAPLKLRTEAGKALAQNALARQRLISTNAMQQDATLKVQAYNNAKIYLDNVENTLKDPTISDALKNKTIENFDKSLKNGNKIFTNSNLERRVRTINATLIEPNASYQTNRISKALSDNLGRSTRGDIIINSALNKMKNTKQPLNNQYIKNVFNTLNKLDNEELLDISEGINPSIGNLNPLTGGAGRVDGVSPIEGNVKSATVRTNSGNTINLTSFTDDLLSK